MNKIKYSFYFLSFLVLLFQSCSLEKRRYTSGFYVQKHSHSGNKKSIAKSSREISDINTSDVKHQIEISALKEAEIKKELVASSAKKQLSVLTFKPIVLRAPGDTCDTIVLRNNIEIKAKVFEISTKLVRYKHCDNPNGPTYNLQLEDVALIKFKNGTKEVFQKAEDPSKTVTQMQVVYSSSTKEELKLENRANAALVCGLVSYPATITYVGGFVLAILAISFGASVIHSMKRNPNLYEKAVKKKAQTGMVLGIVYLSLLILLLILVLAVLTTAFLLI